MNSQLKKVRSFVIRASRTSPFQKLNYEKYFPLYGIPYAPEGFIPKEIFPELEKLVVEIGFGMGDATLEIAENFPGTGFLGIEVHLPGVGRVLGEIHTRGLKNLKVVHHDAVEVLAKLPKFSLDGFHIFFPDPWPKKRHHKRRLLQKAFVDQLVDLLKPGGYFYFATDWEEYALEVRELLRSHPGLRGPDTEWAENISWRPSTKFEKRGVEENRPIRELYFEKIEESSK